MCSTRGEPVENGVQIGGDKTRIGTDAVDEPPIFAADVHDQGLARRQRAIDHERRGIDVTCPQRLGGKPAEGVVADPGADSRSHAQSRRSTAVLAAPPPILRTSSSTVTNSPALGKWGMGGHRWSATTKPRKPRERRPVPLWKRSTREGP